MKTAISLPDELGENIDLFLQKTRMSRSEFFQRAARTYLDQVSAQAITQNLNEVHAEASSPEDAAFRQAALKHFRTLQKNETW